MTDRTPAKASGGVITCHVTGPAEGMPRHRLGENITRILDYWVVKAAGRAMPLRRDFDPLDVPLALPYVLLWNVFDGGASIVCRLAGTALCELAGRELRGLPLEAIHWDRPEATKLEFQHVARTLELDYIEREMQYTAARTYRAYSRLLLPLAGPSGTAPAELLLAAVDLLK
jgi:hypothetical protein